MKVEEVVSTLEIWTNNAERALLEKLKNPVLLSNLSENDQFTIQGLIRKSLVTKIGDTNPRVVANETKK